MTSEENNSLAYNDVLERNDPSRPDDEIYMNHYRRWRESLNLPEDQIEP